MKVLIIEDETAAYESLVEILKEIDASIEVLGNTESVRQTVDWLQKNPDPDLILMDIHLSDGSAFLIIEHTVVEVPIIFTDRTEGESKMSGGIIKEAIFGVINLKLKSIFGKI